MPVELETSTTFGRTWHLSWTFAGDLSAGKEVDLVSDPIDLGVPGEWCLKAKRDVGDSKEGQEVSLYAMGKRRRKIADGDEAIDEAWPTSGSGWWSSIKVLEEDLYRASKGPFSWRLDVDFRSRDLNLIRRPLVAKTAAVFSRSLDKLASAGAVRLWFPDTDLEIWTSADELSTIPYYQTLLSSGFAEAITTRKRRRTDEEASAEGKEEEQDDLLAFDDSDDEGDEIYATDDRTPPDAEQFHEIKIRSAAYATYRAVLTWVHSNHIIFSPLKSRAKVEGESSMSPDELRQTAVDFHSANPFLPIPASPKSVYRLAHLLDLPKLQSLALAAYRDQLDKHNVAYELVSDVSAAYDDLRLAALDVAAKDFKFVKTSAAMNEVLSESEKDGAVASRYAKVIREWFAREQTMAADTADSSTDSSSTDSDSSDSD